VAPRIMPENRHRFRRPQLFGHSGQDSDPV